MNVAAANMIKVAMVENADSKTPSTLAACWEAMKYCFWVANCLDHTASARAVADAKLAYPGNKLQHEAANLALQIEVFGFVIKPDSAGGDDQQRPEQCKQCCNQPELEIVIKHQADAEPAKQPGHHAAQRAASENAPRGIDPHRANDENADRVLAKQGRRQPEQAVDYGGLQSP